MSVQPRVSLRIEYREPVDRYFQLREPSIHPGLEDLQASVRNVFTSWPRDAFMLLDPAIAGHAHDPQHILDSVPHLPPEIAGIEIHHSLTELATVLVDAPEAPSARRAQVEDALRSANPALLADAVVVASDRLGFSFVPDTVLEIDVVVVWSGVPLGGLTGETLDDQPLCIVAATGIDESTLAETIVHEALHAVDMKCDAEDSLVEQLRRAPDGSHQLWHAPLFITAADAVRDRIDPHHVDMGVTSGYYAKVQPDLARLAQIGMTPGDPNP